MLSTTSLEAPGSLTHARVRAAVTSGRQSFTSQPPWNASRARAPSLRGAAQCSRVAAAADSAATA
eukprot:15475115-Alexandrium_andersonii.AAC.1